MPVFVSVTSIEQCNAFVSGTWLVVVVDNDSFARAQPPPVCAHPTAARPSSLHSLRAPRTYTPPPLSTSWILPPLVPTPLSSWVTRRCGTPTPRATARAPAPAACAGRASASSASTRSTFAGGASGRMPTRLASTRYVAGRGVRVGGVRLGSHMEPAVARARCSVCVRALREWRAGAWRARASWWWGW